MSGADRDRWNARHGGGSSAEPAVPAGFVDVVDLVPTVGYAIDLACGRGDGALWLARRGLQVLGVDVSDVAIDMARAGAERHGLGDRCTFLVHDLDRGLPVGPPVDLITCHLFSVPGLEHQLRDRLAPGGVLAITVLSEVGAGPGPYRAGPGELLERFVGLDIRHHVEVDGVATLLAVNTGPTGSNAT